MKINKSGYIIPLTLMLISMAIAFITIIYQRGSVFVPLMGTMMRREKAKLLALSGIDIAMAQLTQQSSVVDSNDSAKKAASLERELLTTLLPALNRWQEFQLKQQRDGVEGTIKISISCEAGKIDINKIYDFSKQQFVGQGKLQGDWQKISKDLLGRIQKMTPGTDNLFQAFEAALKQRTSLFNDATELIMLEAFAPFAAALFYEPPARGMQKDGTRPLYLLDIFTVYGGTTLQPWLFSDSLLGILGVSRAKSGDVKQRQAIVTEWISKWTLTTQWQTQWNSALKPVYGLELQSLPNGLDSVLQERFDPKFFSVVSYGIVGDVTQRAYAIIEREKSTVQGKERYECKLRKFYWM